MIGLVTSGDVRKLKLPSRKRDDVTKVVVVVPFSLGILAVGARWGMAPVMFEEPDEVVLERWIRWSANEGDIGVKE
jgi:hypothetical protein